eukprot:gene15977-biopygen16478
MKKLCKLTVNVTEDPVKQLGYFADVMSSVANYRGARLDPTTVEVVVITLAVAVMPLEYSQVVADMSKERRPSFDIPLQRSEHFFVNVVQQSLVPSSGIVGATVDEETVAVARALVADRRRQSEEKKFNDGKKLICPTCSGVHSAEKCWIVNPAGMEEFIKLNPAKEKAVSAEELWSLENHEEVLVACPAVLTVADQKVLHTGEVLEDVWVYGVFNRSEEDDVRVQEECSIKAPGGDLCAATVVDADRELFFDSMAKKSIFNDLSMFEGAQVNASAAVSFKVMAGEVTTSRGGGRGTITLWNRVTKKVDVLKVEAQYVPESPFNLVSAVSLEDKFGLYAQFGDRVLKDKVGLCEYEVCKKGNVYVLPEVIVEVALPGVACEQKERGPVRDKCNWKFTEFQKWNEEKGPFHLDMCADEHNRQVNEYYSLVNSVFLHCLTGRNFWGNPPYDDMFIEKLLTKVLMDFSKDPANTKFMLVVPCKPNATWWRLTTKFEELHVYSKGSVIFSARTDQCYNVSELFVAPRVDVKIIAHIRLGRTCDKHVEVMDLQRVDLGVNSEELKNSSVISCYVNCMACQVAAPKRPSQTTDRGRVPKSVRKVVEKRSWSMFALEDYRKLVRATGRVFLEEETHVEQVVYDLDVLGLHSDNDSTIVSGKTKKRPAIPDPTVVHPRRPAIPDPTVVHPTRPAIPDPTVVHPSQEKQKVVRSGMVRFDERVDQYGQLVMSWDPSMMKPLKLLYDCESLDGKFVSAFVGAATIILDLRVYVELKGDEFTGVVKLSSAGGGSFWTTVSVFLEARVEHLALLFEYCEQLTVNSFYPLFEKGPGALEWQESDHKEECALIDVKQAILPVETAPAGEKVMRMVAVYKAKLDSAGVLTERKTRWVVCSNGQQHGVHYEDVYAPCTQLSTLRILIQLSLVLGLLAFSLDVITCFLNGELDVDTPMYVSWPNARTVRGVLYGILQKSVYGLKQAPRIWYKTSKEFVLAYDHRLRVSNIDPCLFYIWQPGTLVVFVYVHVDDYTVFTSSVQWKVEFFRVFSEKWPSKDKGPLVDLLGMSMTFRDCGLVRECGISQVGLIQRMLERYAMQDYNPCMTPMEPRLSLMPVDSEEKLEKLPYVNLVMELM